VTAPSIEQAAGRLASAASTATVCEPVRDLIGDLDDAYAVQQHLADARTAAGSRVAGCKIGLTSRSVQVQLGVGEPDFGLLFDDMIYAHGEPVPIGRFIQPRVEAEVAFVLGADIDRPNASVADVLRATDFVLPAIEIVDSRVRDWDISIIDTVADNASSGAIVLGATPRALEGLDLASVGMVLDRDGEQAVTGNGSACLGSPVVAVAWLARELIRRGRNLREGDIVLSGALGPMLPIDRPGRYEARFDGLGTVQAVLDEEDVS